MKLGTRVILARRCTDDARGTSRELTITKYKDTTPKFRGLVILLQD